MSREEMLELWKNHKDFRYRPTENSGKIHYFKGKPSDVVRIKLSRSYQVRWIADRIEDCDILSAVGIPYSWSESDMDLVQFILSEYGYGIEELLVD